ncbi:hypothetical protein [Neomoorella thermoacetica]|nr:hypothetical protein [Moorella thermoacetica]
MASDGRWQAHCQRPHPRRVEAKLKKALARSGAYLERLMAIDTAGIFV